MTRPSFEDLTSYVGYALFRNSPVAQEILDDIAAHNPNSTRSAPSPQDLRMAEVKTWIDQWGARFLTREQKPYGWHSRWPVIGLLLHGVKFGWSDEKIASVHQAGLTLAEVEAFGEAVSDVDVQTLAALRGHRTF